MAGRVSKAGRLHRSPTYPFIPLERALERIDQLSAAGGGNPVSPDQSQASWGYGIKSSGAIQTEAALKQFGLITLLGRGPNRKLALSDLGRQLVQRQHLAPAERHRLLTQAALTPAIHRDLHQRWPDQLPRLDAERFLVAERHFIQRGASELLREYDQTMRFVRAQGSSSSPAPDMDNEIIVTDHGGRITVSATVNRAGLERLVKLLEHKLVNT